MITLKYMTQHCYIKEKMLFAFRQTLAFFAGAGFWLEGSAFEPWYKNTTELSILGWNKTSLNITSCLYFLFSSTGLSGVIEAKTKFEPVLGAFTGNTDDLVIEASADRSFSLRRKKDPRLNCQNKEYVGNWFFLLLEL